MTLEAGNASRMFPMNHTTFRFISLVGGLALLCNLAMCLPSKYASPILPSLLSLQSEQVGSYPADWKPGFIYSPPCIDVDTDGSFSSISWRGSNFTDSDGNLNDDLYLATIVQNEASAYSDKTARVRLSFDGDRVNTSTLVRSTRRLQRVAKESGILIAVELDPSVQSQP